MITNPSMRYLVGVAARPATYATTSLIEAHCDATESVKTVLNGRYTVELDADERFQFHTLELVRRALEREIEIRNNSTKLA